MPILRKNEVKDYNNKEPFVIYDEGNYYGIFKKKEGKLNSKSIVSIPENVLPYDLRWNYKLIYDILSFKTNYKLKFTFLEVKNSNGKISYEGVCFINANISKITSSIEIDLEKTIFNTKTISNISRKTLKHSILGIIPQEIQKVIRNTQTLYLRTHEEISYIPFEILFDIFGILVKRVFSINKNRISSGYKNKFLILFKEDKRFKYIQEESNEIYKKLKNNFTVEISSDIKSVEDLGVLFGSNDVVFISAHTNNSGIEIGDIILNKKSIKHIHTPPKFAFFNNCHFGEIEDVVSHLINSGSIEIIYPAFKVPDSWQTKYFSTTFFGIISETYDFDLSFYITSLISKNKNYYNHLLYRIAC
ncbi:MAG: hypothetical protein N2712_05225 [Brevinematales bacterium]|nr:hypothetical protein [Brevinematales bacterium]